MSRRRFPRAPRIHRRRPSLTTVIMVILTAAIWIGGAWALLHTYDGGDPGRVYPTTTR